MAEYVRTQILLEKNQRDELDTLAQIAGISFSELVRDFLDVQLRSRTTEEMRRTGEQLGESYDQDTGDFMND
jgi:hypothetical protein